MKFAILQLNVGLFSPLENAAKIAAACKGTEKIDIWIVPENGLCGPEYESFRHWPDFELICSEALDLLAANIQPGQILVCTVPHAGSVVITHGKWRQARKLEFDSKEIALQTPGNPAPPTASIIIDLEDRLFHPHGQEEFENRLIERRPGALVFAPNLVGGYDQKVYAGQSTVKFPDGSVAARGKAFEEDILIFDSATRIGEINPLLSSSQAAQWAALVLGTRDFVKKHGGKKVLLGLSGGMDSALVACIAQEALGPGNVLGVLMPSPFSSQGSIDDSLELAQNLGITTTTIPIEPMMKAFEAALGPVFARIPGTGTGLAFENIQARIRGTLLMAIANHSGSLVLNTGNKSEAAMGYCTLYGDAIGAVAVIGDLYKTSVYELAEWLNREKGLIPENILRKPPSAELRPNQKDTDSLPPYPWLDGMLQNIEQNEPLPREANIREELLEIRKKMAANEFKRKQSPPPLLVS